MSYSWDDFNLPPSAVHLTSDVAYRSTDSSQNGFMSTEGCYTFPYQTQPNTSQWMISYTMSPHHKYTVSQTDSMITSTPMDPYSPSFSTPTSSPSPTDSLMPYFTTSIDKKSSQTAQRVQRRRAQNRESQRAFRERKIQQIKDLQQNLAELQRMHEKLQESYAELSARVNGSEGGEYR